MAEVETKRKLSEAAYGSEAERAHTAQKTGLTYNPRLSGKQIAVFENPQTREVTVAHRGTATKHDVVTDLALAVGLERFTPRYKKAQRAVAKVKREYGADAKISQTGHSLGGAIAQQMAKEGGGRATTFNKGAGLRSIGGRRSAGQTDIRHERDIISALSLLERRSARPTTITKRGRVSALTAHRLESLK